MKDLFRYTSTKLCSFLILIYLAAFLYLLKTNPFTALFHEMITLFLLSIPIAILSFYYYRYQFKKYGTIHILAKDLPRNRIDRIKPCLLSSFLESIIFFFTGSFFIQSYSLMTSFVLIVPFLFSLLFIIQLFTIESIYYRY